MVTVLPSLSQTSPSQPAGRSILRHRGAAAQNNHEELNAEQARESAITRRAVFRLPQEPPSPLISLNERLSRAEELANAKRPREAMSLLASAVNDEDAYNTYRFQIRLGTVFMEIADELVAANRLGAFLVKPDEGGSWLKLTIEAERLSCYLGSLGSYSRAMAILQATSERETFIEKAGIDTLRKLEKGLRNGIGRAMLEPLIILHRICQTNSNLASREFVQQALASGQLAEGHPLVRSFRTAEADPLYDAIVEATAPFETAVRASGQPPQLFWRDWLEQAKQTFFQLPEVQLARSVVFKSAESAEPAEPAEPAAL